MNILKLTLLAFLVFGCVSCKGRAKTGEELVTYINPEQKKAEIYQQQFDSILEESRKSDLPDSITKLLLLPDSIKNKIYDEHLTGEQIRRYWTPEMRKLMKAMAEIELNYVKVIDNKFVVEMSREDFAKIGLAEPYYAYIIRSYENTNAMNLLNNTSSEEVREEWQKMQDKAKKELARKD